MVYLKKHKLVKNHGIVERPFQMDQMRVSVETKSIKIEPKISKRCFYGVRIIFGMTLKGHFKWPKEWAENSGPECSCPMLLLDQCINPRNSDDDEKHFWVMQIKKIQAQPRYWLDLHSKSCSIPIPTSFGHRLCLCVQILFLR